MAPALEACYPLLSGHTPQTMKKPPLKNFHAQIVDSIGSDIVTGVLSPGQQLPTEAELAESFQASRLLIREAMKSLAAKGLVSIRPRIGTHVLPREQWNLFDPSVLSWYGKVPLDAKFIEDLMELRSAIEPLAARLAATRAEPVMLEELKQAYDAMASAKDQASYISADLKFHGAVIHSCGNQFIQQLEVALSEVLKTSFTASSKAWGPDKSSLALHRDLLDAIADKSGLRAERASLALIDRASDRIRNGFQKHGLQ